MSRRRTVDPPPEFPPLTAAEKGLLLEGAAEAYFLLMNGVVPTDDAEAERKYRILRAIFFRGSLPDPTVTKQERGDAAQEVKQLWDRCAAYIATNPNSWVFPQRSLASSQVAALIRDLRRAATAIHRKRHPMLVDQEAAYLDIPTEFLFDGDPIAGPMTSAEEVLGEEEVQVPFAFLFRVRDDMLLFPEAATAAVRRVLLGDLGVKLREALLATPELAEVLVDEPEAVQVVPPAGVPPRTTPEDLPRRVISPERLRRAVYGRFRRNAYRADWFDGRCYVNIPRLGPEGETLRYICFETPGPGITGTGLTFQQV